MTKIYNTLWGKTAIVVVVLCLYSFPYYQTFHGAQAQNRQARTVAPKNEVATQQQPIFKEQFIDSPGMLCHSSTLAPIAGDKMACVWYAGSDEGKPDVSIYLAFFDEGKWTKPVMVVNREQCARELHRYVRKLGNPIIVQDQQQRLWLFFSSVAIGGWSMTSINYKVSQDGGETWGSTQKLILSPFVNFAHNVKNKVVHLDDGSFLVPVYQEFLRKCSQLLWIRPYEGGVHYNLRQVTHEFTAIQPTVVSDGKRKLIAYFRNPGPDDIDKKKRKAKKGKKKRKKKRFKNYILKAHSEDLGVTWSDIARTSLPNPNSGFDMIRLSDGSHLGVINDDFYSRKNLTLVKSNDGGKNWIRLKVLIEVESEHNDDQMSYPAIERSHSGLYHITYSFRRQRIKHIAFNEAWVKQQEELKH